MHPHLTRSECTFCCKNYKFGAHKREKLCSIFECKSHEIEKYDEKSEPIRIPFLLSERIVHDHGTVRKPADGKYSHNKSEHFDHLNDATTNVIKNEISKVNVKIR